MDELDETVLNLQQRMKRAQIMRRNEPKIRRAREMAQKRLAPEKNIKKRAYAMARQLVRKRVAGSRGAEYEKLGPTEKMIIDRAVEKKQKAIKKLALRLIPKVKSNEQKRLHTFMQGQRMQNHGAPEGHKAAPGAAVSEALNNKFEQQFQDVDGNKTVSKKTSNPNIVQYNTFGNEKLSDTNLYKSIAKKAKKTGIKEDILGEVYDRGLTAWYEETGVSPQQYAFARVNSFINQGKSYFNEDADLHEIHEAAMYHVSDEDHKMLHPRAKGFDSLARAKAFADTHKKHVVIHQSDKSGNIVSRQLYQKHAHSYPEKPSVGDAKHVRDLKEADISKFNIPMSRPKKPTKAPTRTFGSVLDEVDVPAKHLDRARSVWKRTNDVNAVKKFVASVKEEVEIDESNNTPYVKPHIEKGSTKQTAWKASNKHGRVKYFGMDFKKSAEKHAGISEDVELDEEAEDRIQKITHKGKHVANIRTYRGRAGGWLSQVEHPNGSDASKKYGITHNDTKKEMVRMIKKYHTVNEEVQQTNENFIDGKGPGKPGDASRHGLKGKSATQLRKIRSSETASPRTKQLAHWMLNMHHNEETEIDEVYQNDIVKSNKLSSRTLGKTLPSGHKKIGTLPTGHEVHMKSSDGKNYYRVVHPTTKEVNTVLTTKPHKGGAEEIDTLVANDNSSGAHHLYQHLVLKHDKVLSSNNQSAGARKVWAKAASHKSINTHGYDPDKKSAFHAHPSEDEHYSTDADYDNVEKDRDSSKRDKRKYKKELDDIQSNDSKYIVMHKKLKEETEISELTAKLITAYRRGMEKDVALKPLMDPKKRAQRERGFKTSTNKILGLAKVNATESLKDPEDNPCWKGYKPVGTKKKAGKTVPNCVPESIEEGYDVNSKHYKALTDLDLNTKNRDMTTQNDGYGPLNPNDLKGSKPFWEAKAKMWKTTTAAAMEARCGNCAAFNQAPAIMKKMAEELGPAGEKIQDLANLGFCELFEFKCAGDRTCNKWLVNGPITEEDTGNGTRLVDKLSNNSKKRKKIEVVDRKPPYTDLTRQAEIKNKVIDEAGNCQNDPKKREQGTSSLTKAYKKDTPGQDINEAFNIQYAAGVGVTLTAADLGMKVQGSFAYHPSVVVEEEEVDEEVVTADKAPVVIPAHKDAYGNAIPAKTVMRKKNKVIVKSGNTHDGDA